MMVGEGAEAELNVALRVRYCWGREGREFLAGAVYDRSVIEGTACSCCRFHVTDRAPGMEKGCAELDGDRCPVHAELYGS